MTSMPWDAQLYLRLFTPENGAAAASFFPRRSV
jgi:hypothetical protein